MNCGNRLAVHREFISTKIIMFCYYGGKYSLLSYLVVLLVSFGMNPQQAGIITGLRLAVQVIGGIVLGYVSDIIKKRKLVVLVAAGVASISIFVLPFVGYAVRGSYYSPELNVPHNENKTNATQSMSRDDTDKDTKVLFWYFLILCMVYGFSDGIHGMVDSFVMRIVKMNGVGKTNYSYQRLWGSIGYGITPVITGLVIDFWNDRYISTYIPVVLIFLSLNIVLFINLIYTSSRESGSKKVPLNTTGKILDRSKNDQKVIRLLTKSLCKMGTMIVLYHSFLTGVAAIAQWGFLYLLMEEKMTNTSKSIMGISFLAASVIEAFVAPGIKKFTSKLGSPYYSMAISSFGYFITFVVYYYNTNSYYIVGINMIAGCTYPFFLYTGQEELYRLTDPDCLTVMFTLDRSIHSGVGGGIGGVVAGSLYKSYGGRVMYLALGLFYLLCAVKITMYGFYKNYKERGHSKREINAVEEKQLKKKEETV